MTGGEHVAGRIQLVIGKWNDRDRRSRLYVVGRRHTNLGT